MYKTNTKVDNQGVCVRGGQSPASLSSAMKARQSQKIREIRETLVAAGYISLHQQATALGLGRSTAWSVLKANHKSSGLSATVIMRMLASPQLPTPVRHVIEEYVRQKCAGNYGHNITRLRMFRARLGQDLAKNSDGFAAMVEVALVRNCRTSNADR
jgi:predicted DNA-binding transcriptional regulator AlpA